MHSPAPLPHVDLTDTQWRLLARLVSGTLPDPSDRRLSARAVLPHGLDPDQVRADLPELIWLRLIARQDGCLLITDLGAAIQYRALFESSRERLGEVAQLAELHRALAPRFAQAVRRLADGTSSFAEAQASLGDPV